jgi:two-component system sensor histidine kinase ChvG
MIWTKIRNFISRISFRLLCFNILLVFLPIMGSLYLDTYEKQLLKEQEDSMVQQGRLIASAIISHLELLQTGEHPTTIDSDFAEKLLINLKQRTESRLRIIDMNRMLVADSAVLEEEIFEEEELEYTWREETPAEETNWLYETASLPVRLYRKFFMPPQPVSEPIKIYGENSFSGPEIDAALEGMYGATTRLSAGGQQSVNLYIAIPIQYEDSVIGAVLVSQSTYKILQNLYEVRLGIFYIFLFSVFAALLISLILSYTIARPLNKMRKDAEMLLDARGRLTRPLKPFKRWDEIGTLSRSLYGLTQQVEKHISFIESFAADLSHEFKNPLASIRTATEIAIDAKKEKERNHFLHLVQKDISRMEQLLAGVKEISLIDTHLSEEECKNIEIQTLLKNCVEGFKLRNNNIQFKFHMPKEKIYFYAAPERIVQVFTNLLDNAISFSPKNGCIGIFLKEKKPFIEIGISNEGPSIPQEHMDKIFKRFFSFRTDVNHQDHTGLGLAIVKAIVEGYGGNISATNLKEKGTMFILHLPKRVY